MLKSKEKMKILFKVAREKRQHTTYKVLNDLSDSLILIRNTRGQKIWNIFKVLK